MGKDAGRTSHDAAEERARAREKASLPVRDSRGFESVGVIATG